MSSMQIMALENEFKKLLIKLLFLFEPGKSRPVSHLDPLSGLIQQTGILHSVTRGLIAKHEEIEKVLFADNSQWEKKLQAWLTDPELLGYYSTLMNGSMKLLFCSDISLYQFSINSEFTTSVLRAHNLLSAMSTVGDESNSQLLSILHSFECHFKTHWNTINCNSFNFDNVRDLLSHAHDVVCAPLLNLSEVVKRDYFRLTLPKFHYANVLVELFQLSNGELAIFNVNCGKLPHTIDSVKSLLGELVSCSSSGKSVEIGRSLLFPTLRKDDLDILTEVHGCIELKTKTGNNVVFKLNPVDPTQWDTHWRLFFYSLFSRSASCTNVSGLSYTHMTKSAHSYQNFKLKHDKLTSLRPDGSSGLAVELPNKTGNPLPKVISPNSNHDTLLHKSKPLNLSSLSRSSLNKTPSFAEIEQLNCDKLLELDRSISMAGSPVLEPKVATPTLENFKRVPTSSSIEVMDFSSGEYADEGESVISAEETEEPEEVGAFDLESEYRRPQLTKRKSSSLLSLFSHNKSKSSLKNKKDLHLDLSSTNSSASLLVLPTPASSTPTPTSITSSANISYCQLPDDIDLSSCVNICQHEVKVSYWTRNTWNLVSKEWLSASIYETNQSELLFIVSDVSNRNKHKMCATISSNWKQNRSTAQDVQLRIPKEDLISTAITIDGTIISIRCPRVEQLMNSLYHCIRQNVSPPTVMQKSYTQGTLSSTSSTFSMLDRNVVRSDTNSTGLSSILQDSLIDTKEKALSLLLLSEIKVRLHKKDPEYGWKLFNKGKLDVLSQEVRGSVVAIKFELMDDRTSKSEYQSKLNGIRRIGRTGMSFVDFQDDYLIEFKNQEIADRVFMLITSLI